MNPYQIFLITLISTLTAGFWEPIFAKDAEDWFTQGNQYRKEHRLLEAIDAYQRSIELNPNFWVAHQNLGLAFKKTRQFQKAVDAFQNALKLAPENLDIHLNLGNVYNYLENWEAAIQHLNLVVHRRRNDAIAHGGLGWAMYNYDRGPPFKLLVVINLKKAIALFEVQNQKQAAEATRKTLEEALFKYGMSNNNDSPL